MISDDRILAAVANIFQNPNGTDCIAIVRELLEEDRQARWIDVNERLPSFQHMVLCYMPVAYSGYKGIHYGWLEMTTNDWRTHTPHEYAEKMESEKYTGAKNSKVTHWMPLPEGPK